MGTAKKSQPDNTEVLHKNTAQQRVQGEKPKSEDAPKVSPDKMIKEIDGKSAELQEWLETVRSQENVILLYIDQRSGGFYAQGLTEISGDVVGHTQIKYTQKDKIPREAVAEILFQERREIRFLYIPPPSHKKALEILNRHHVLILYGNANRGKRTAAIYLLDQMCGSESSILELNPQIDLSTLEITSTESRGYLISSYIISNEKQFIFQIKRLSQNLQKTGGYLIITIDERFDTPLALPNEALRDYICDWNTTPDSQTLLRKFLEWHIDDPKIRDRAFELCGKEQIQDHLLPFEVERLSICLKRVAEGEIPPDQISHCWEANTEERIKDWFVKYPSAEEGVFLLTAAVYNGASYQTVLAEEKRLLSLLVTEANIQPAPSIFPNFNIQRQREQRLKRIGATLRPQYKVVEFGRYPVKILEFDNPNMPRAVLRYVWENFDHLRMILVHWLKEAVFEAPLEVRVRAAAAVGELAKYDFDYIRRAILLPWATSDDWAVREAAAFALAIPAWSTENIPILGLLHHWSTLDNLRLRWTAAIAYGGWVGLRFPEAALRGLYYIAKDKFIDLSLLKVLHQSMANLFEAGKKKPEFFEKVLDALVKWGEEQRDKREKGEETDIVIPLNIMTASMFLYIAEAPYRKNVENIAAKTAAEQPTLLWLIGQDENLDFLILTLWRRALHLKETRHKAVARLRQWLVDATNAADPDMEKKLIHLFQRLYREGTTREAQRIEYYLRRWSEIPEIMEAALKVMRALVE